MLPCNAQNQGKRARYASIWSTQSGLKKAKQRTKTELYKSKSSDGLFISEENLSVYNETHIF